MIDWKKHTGNKLSEFLSLYCGKFPELRKIADGGETIHRSLFDGQIKKKII